MSNQRLISPWLRGILDEFYAAKQAWWEAAEYETRLYDTELSEYKQTHPMPCIQDFLIDARKNREAAEAARMTGEAA
jgi:hypothetical protein